MASAAHNIRSPSTLLNPVKVHNLINAAISDVVIDHGWSGLSLAMTLRQLTSRPLVFQTLPITGYGTLDGQDVNLIDPDQIRSVVQRSFTDHTTMSAPPTSTVDVVNSSGRDGAAAKTAAVLRQQGFTTGTLSTGTPRTTSTVAYSDDASTDAHTVAQALGGLNTTADAHLPPGHVQVILGHDFTPRRNPASPPAANTAPPGPQGQPIQAPPSTIPCVN